MKNITFLLLIIWLTSCEGTVAKKYTIKCSVDKCCLVNKVSIADEISGRNRWSIETSCGINLVSKKPYKNGDSIEIIVIK